MKHIWKTLFTILICVVFLHLGIGCCKNHHTHVSHHINATKIHYIVVSDTHWYAPYALDITPHDIEDGENTLYIGDIYDLKSATHNDIEEVLQSIRQFRQEKGERYVRGNHEGYAFLEFITPEHGKISFERGGHIIDFDHVDYTIRPQNSSNPDERILFTHGHKGIDPRFDKETIEKYEQSTGGVGSWKRLWLHIASFFRERLPNTPTEHEITNAVHLALTMNCRTVVFGHTHVRRLFDKYCIDPKTGETIRVIAVPRGITHLSL